MAANALFADSPSDVGLNPAKVEELLSRAEREVKEGLLPSAQIAIARNGKIGAMRTFGNAVEGGALKPATDETLYCVFSCTKAIVASAIWILIGEGNLDVGERVAEIVPEFSTNGKEAVTVEQVLMHISGFPDAPYPPSDWVSRTKRLERFKSWRLQFPPGERFVYHPLSGFWVLAEIIERRAGIDYRLFVRERIAQALKLPHLMLGAPRSQQDRIADCVYVGESPTLEEYLKLGLKEAPIKLDESFITAFNAPVAREGGAPGGGAVATAADLALFYQGLLHNPPVNHGKPIWKPDTLKEALTVRSGDYFDPVFRYKCNRALGVIVAGDDQFVSYRGFGRSNSALAFGHGGAGGQIGWGDPATGISIGYCTNGFDRNDIRQGRRSTAISSIAAACAA